VWAVNGVAPSTITVGDVAALQEVLGDYSVEEGRGVVEGSVSGGGAG